MFSSWQKYVNDLNKKHVHHILSNIVFRKIGGRDSSVGKSSASQSRDPGSNPGGGLTRVTQCMKEGKRLPAVKVILHQLAWLTGA